MTLLPRRLTAVLGWCSLAALVAVAVLGLWVAPPDALQSDAQRLMYLHVPTAWLAYFAFFVTAVTSVLYLIPRTRSLVWDRVAGCSAEIGVVFTGLTLVLGALWGRPIWGVYWTWDARLVTTAVLFFLYLGYLALRRYPGDRGSVALRSAVVALIAFADVPIVHFSVTWWRTLHQEATVFNPELSAVLDGTMAFTLWFSVLAFTIAYLYLLAKRYELASIEDHLDDAELDAAIAQRLAEGQARPAGGDLTHGDQLGRSSDQPLGAGP